MQLTPLMFSDLVKRHEYEHQRQELLFGIVASNVVNFAMGAPQEPTCPADFMPSQFNKKRKEQTAEELQAHIRAQFAAAIAAFETPRRQR